MEVGESGIQRGDGGRAVITPGHYLGEQRFVVYRNLVADAKRGIHANALTLRKLQLGYGSYVGQEGVGVFGIDSGFNGVAIGPDVALAVGEGNVGGCQQLEFDDILSGEELGNAMFDLEAGGSSP